MQAKSVPREEKLKSKYKVGITLLIGSAMIVLVISLSGLAGPVEGANVSFASGGWTTVFEESFESGIGGDWSVSDTNGSTNGEYYWATTNTNQSIGSYSVWVAGGGNEGSTLSAGIDDYPNNALSSMIHDPVDLSGADSARLSFDYWVETESPFDIFVVSASVDGASYANLAVYHGSSGGWQSEVINLDAYIGQAQVWIRFFFSSNATNTAEGAYVDNILLETASEFFSYLPITIYTVPPYFYFDDFSDPSSGWPIRDNTHVPNDCFKWYYSATNTYQADICDDRTDIKASPKVELPSGDYEIDVDARFRQATGWWTSYGVIFDAKDDLGDYHMLWILWEGKGKHKWKIMRDVPGNQEDVTSWSTLDSSRYNYGDGTAWNNWRIVRTENDITIYVNGKHLRTVNEKRPTSERLKFFALYTSTYETDRVKTAFDNFLINDLSGIASVWEGESTGIYVKSDFSQGLEGLLPQAIERSIPGID